MREHFFDMIELFTTDRAVSLLSQGRWGLEKEALRLNRDGSLALTPHPGIFGDKSKNPYFKTDFSESQIELVTPPFRSMEKTHEFLTKLQLEAEQAIGGELLWPLSMPGPLSDDADIPIARYDDSPEGREKEIYRSGLALRYGKKMQMISGIHYNFSFLESFWSYLQEKMGTAGNRQDFINDSYFALARNFLRNRWLLLYLFGASPAADESYRDSAWRRCAQFWGSCDKSFSAGDYIRRATSLRMSPFGYDNSLEGPSFISHNSLAEHVRDLRSALAAPNPRYSEIGIFQNNRQVQLNDRVLQLESEYYSPIRFKQTTESGERPLDALERRGMDHIELRLFDLDPYEKTGISLDRMRFVHAFILFCLFEESPPLREDESLIVNYNSHITALNGRSPGLELIKNGHETVPLAEEAGRLLYKLQAVAEILDEANGGADYVKAVQSEQEKLADPTLLPSAKIAHEMERNGESHLEFGLRRAGENRTEHYGFPSWQLETVSPLGAGQLAPFSK